MKIRVDIEEHKLPLPAKLLQRLPFLREKRPTTHREKVLQDLKKAIAEMHLIKNGQLTARNAEDLFDEL